MHKHYYVSYRLPFGVHLRLAACLRGKRSPLYTAGAYALLWLAVTLETLARWVVVAVLVIALLQLFGVTAKAASIPKAAEQHRATLIRTARVVWGMNAPVAVFAGQIHAESRWNTEAKSPVGALGMAQFMPATGKWMPNIDPELAPPSPRNPAWAIRALVRYDLYLWERVDAVSDFERMAFTLSAYNGGLGWVNRDKALAAKRGLDRRRWFGNVEKVNAGRSAASFHENRRYPGLILNEFQWLYTAAKWGAGLPEVVEAEWQ